MWRIFSDVMAKKIVKIEYDPYTNHIQFSISTDSGESWHGVADTSELLKYQNQECVFSNCVEDIVSYINQYQNSSVDGLYIQFIGTDEDFAILNETIARENKGSAKRGIIQSERIGYYRSAHDAIAIIRNAYGKIAYEFDDYLPGNDRYNDDADCEEIGRLISDFSDTISKDIPICVIGTYSVGKSAFINAIIGAEILPSKVDPCTAKNVRVENSSSVSLSLEYKDEFITFVIEDGSVSLANGASANAEEFRGALFNRLFFQNKDANEILHDMLVVFNEREDTFPEVINVGWNIVIRLPFVNSILKQDDCKIVFYDTPGSNNSDIDQKAHRKSLEQMLEKQTNALPIFVMDRNQVIANDNIEVKRLLDENRKGFSNPNCLIVFSKAENLPNATFNQPIPPALLNWHGKATFLYVCAVGAIGDKKKSTYWLDPEYQDGYKDWKLKYNSDHRSLPRYNIIPCGRIMNAELRARVGESLYATGIPSVEDEINYYVRRYADYKKCVNGCESLRNALSLAKKQLATQRQQLAETKSKQIKEQKAKRQELISAIDAVKIKQVSVQDVIPKYKMVLDQYCLTVLPEIIRIWPSAQKSGDATNYVKQHMQAHCMEGLFKKAYEGEDGIQREIVRILSENANAYKSELLKIVQGKESSLSDEANRELVSIFQSIVTPSFIEVGIKGDNLFRFLQEIINQIPILKDLIDQKFLERKYLESLASSICSQLKHQTGGLFKKDKLGLFEEHCIQQPVQAYFAQLKKWQKTHVEKIKATLDKENYILSQYDARIVSLKQQIEQLNERLSNLADVDELLTCVLSAKEIC